jgi:hypothetical protein
MRIVMVAAAALALGAGLGGVLWLRGSTAPAVVVAAPEPPGREMSLGDFMRRGRELAPATAAPSAAEHRRAVEAGLSARDGAARRHSLLELAQLDPPAALVAARAHISDPELFVVAAGVLLQPGRAPAGDDLARVQLGLERSRLDEPTRLAVTSLLFRTLLESHPKQAAQYAARLLASRDPATRYQTLGALIGLPSELAVPLLHPALRDPDAAIRQQARSSLAYLERANKHRR